MRKKSPPQSGRNLVRKDSVLGQHVQRTASSLSWLVFRRRFVLLGLVVWFAAHLSPPSLIMIEDSEAPVYSPEFIANQTLNQNAFIQSLELFAPFTKYFRGVYVPPGHFIINIGDDPAFVIVENGSLAINSSTIVSDLRHGDSYG